MCVKPAGRHQSRLHRPGRAPKYYERQWLPHCARLVPRYGQELRGVGDFLGRLAFNRSFRGRSTLEICGNVKAEAKRRGGEIARRRLPRTSGVPLPPKLLIFGTAGWIRTTDLLIHSQAL
jgi:hypothetical protein